MINGVKILQDESTSKVVAFKYKGYTGYLRKDAFEKASKEWFDNFAKESKETFEELDKVKKSIESE